MTHHYGSSPNIRARRPAGPLVVGLIAMVAVATLVPSGGGIRASADLSPDEMAIASKLVAEGRTVKALVESTRQGVRTADYVVDGVTTELKSISNLTAKDLSGALSRRILDGAGQAPHLLMDVRQQAGMTRELVVRAIRRAFGADRTHRIQQIRIIGNGFDLTVPRIPWKGWVQDEG